MRNFEQEYNLMVDILEEVEKQHAFLDEYRRTKSLQPLYKSHDHEQIVRRKMKELLQMQYSEEIKTANG